MVGEKKKKNFVLPLALFKSEFGVFGNDGMIREIIAHPYKLFTDYKTAQQYVSVRIQLQKQKVVLAVLAEWALIQGMGCLHNQEPEGAGS